ncbi:putative cytochrome p450 304a1-like protein [Lasius niger]|uniref:Putative cytochrome p450 304a1-like protein n=1 Tax=Lasius niger TaxID=67767 RepID=A0A0J7KE26_LASNI|nr:putative cytochrome p450 304a1-like protein [Lasius niger]KMQ88469.1 putative cytochrome p450 304a1-like protein [Lasius niger]
MKSHPIHFQSAVEATIRESRIETLGVIHKCVKKTTGDYEIPAKHTPVITNVAAMNNDLDMWGDPENFRSEIFLNENAIKQKLIFGFGRRLCAGETYARYNIFGSIALLLQNFNFFFVEGEPSSLEDKVPGLIISPKEL